jgi:isoquinoline 1-oxidoreductase alpha subunit
MIMAAAALLKDKPNPSDDDINAAITNLCRCGTYGRIRKAIHMASAGRIDSGVPGPETNADEAAGRVPSLKG